MIVKAKHATVSVVQLGFRQAFWVDQSPSLKLSDYTSLIAEIDQLTTQMIALASAPWNWNQPLRVEGAYLILVADHPITVNSIVAEAAVDCTFSAHPWSYFDRQGKEHAVTVQKMTAGVLAVTGLSSLILAKLHARLLEKVQTKGLSASRLAAVYRGRAETLATMSELVDQTLILSVTPEDLIGVEEDVLYLHRPAPVSLHATVWSSQPFAALPATVQTKASDLVALSISRIRALEGLAALTTEQIRTELTDIGAVGWLDREVGWLASTLEDQIVFNLTRSELDFLDVHRTKAFGLIDLYMRSVLGQFDLTPDRFREACTTYFTVLKRLGVDTTASVWDQYPSLEAYIEALTLSTLGDMKYTSVAQTLVDIRRGLLVKTVTVEGTLVASDRPFYNWVVANSQLEFWHQLENAEGYEVNVVTDSEGGHSMRVEFVAPSGAKIVHTYVANRSYHIPGFMSVSGDVPDVLWTMAMDIVAQLDMIEQIILTMIGSTDVRRHYDGSTFSITTSKVKALESIAHYVLNSDRRPVSY